MASPLRDMSLQMVVEETICPVQKKEHLTIKKKYSSPRPTGTTTTVRTTSEGFPKTHRDDYYREDDM